MSKHDGLGGADQAQARMGMERRGRMGYVGKVRQHGACHMDCAPDYTSFRVYDTSTEPPTCVTAHRVPGSVDVRALKIGLDAIGPGEESTELLEWEREQRSKQAATPIGATGVERDAARDDLATTQAQLDELMGILGLGKATHQERLDGIVQLDKTLSSAWDSIEEKRAIVETLAGVGDALGLEREDWGSRESRDAVTAQAKNYRHLMRQQEWLGAGRAVRAIALDLGFTLPPNVGAPRHEWLIKLIRGEYAEDTTRTGDAEKRDRRFIVGFCRARLEGAWQRYPQMRFGQLIANAIIAGEGAHTPMPKLFHISDEVLLRGLQEMRLNDDVTERMAREPAPAPPAEPQGIPMGVEAAMDAAVDIIINSIDGLVQPAEGGPQERLRDVARQLDDATKRTKRAEETLAGVRKRIPGRFLVHGPGGAPGAGMMVGPCLAVGALVSEWGALESERKEVYEALGLLPQNDPKHGHAARAIKQMKDGLSGIARAARMEHPLQASASQIKEHVNALYEAHAVLECQHHEILAALGARVESARNHESAIALIAKLHRAPVEHLNAIVKEAYLKPALEGASVEAQASNIVDQIRAQKFALSEVAFWCTPVMERYDPVTVTPDSAVAAVQGLLKRANVAESAAKSTEDANADHAKHVALDATLEALEEIVDGIEGAPEMREERPEGLEADEIPGIEAVLHCIYCGGDIGSVWAGCACDDWRGEHGELTRRKFANSISPESDKPSADSTCTGPILQKAIVRMDYELSQARQERDTALAERDYARPALATLAVIDQLLCVKPEDGPDVRLGVLLDLLKLRAPAAQGGSCPIDAACDLLNRAWKRHPEMRLGQLVENANNDGSCPGPPPLSYVADGWLMDGLQRMIDEAPTPQTDKGEADHAINAHGDEAPWGDEAACGEAAPESSPTPEKPDQ